MSETELEVGDRVRTVTMPSEFQRDAFGSEPSEVVGTVVEIVVETSELSPNNTMEQTLAIIEGDDGEEERVNVEALNNEIEGKDGGVTIQILEDDDEDEDEDEPEIVADGGEDVTEHVEDETIEDAIEDHDGPMDHPETATVEEVRDALAWLQRSLEEFWGEWMDNVENGECEVVHEGDDVIVFSTGDDSVVRRDLREHYDGDLGERVPEIANAIHHELARDCCDYDWGHEYPLVVRKPTGLEGGQQYTESIVNGLMRRGLSPGQAWAYYGVEIRGNSRNQWATRCGYSDHSAVSEPLRKAHEKLP